MYCEFLYITQKQCFFSGPDAVPTSLLSRLGLLVYFSVFYRDNVFPNLKCVPEPFA